jgi:hypothetical protein
MRLRYYFVTFDIRPSLGRTGEYAPAKNAVRTLVGDSNYFELTLQGCIVRTDRLAADLHDAIKNRLKIGIDAAGCCRWGLMVKSALSRS